MESETTVDNCSSKISNDVATPSNSHLHIIMGL